jgi:transposase
LKRVTITWYDRRASQLQRACRAVSGQLQAGIPIGRAISLIAAKFRGRALGSSHRLRLSAATLLRLWNASDRGSDLRAFQFRYRFRLRLVAARWERRGVCLASLALFGLEPPGVPGRLKTIAQLTALTRSSIRNQVRRERLLQFDKMNPAKHRKPRNLGKIANLPADQRAQIDRWLFNENLIYAEIARRIQREFGMSIAVSTLCDHYAAQPGKGHSKPRLQGKIRNLPAPQREKIHQMFRDNFHYASIAEQMKRDFGVLIAVSSLCTYYGSNQHEIFGAASAEAPQ